MVINTTTFLIARYSCSELALIAQFVQHLHSKQKILGFNLSFGINFAPCYITIHMHICVTFTHLLQFPCSFMILNAGNTRFAVSGSWCNSRGQSRIFPSVDVVYFHWLGFPPWLIPSTLHVGTNLSTSVLMANTETLQPEQKSNTMFACTIVPVERNKGIEWIYFNCNLSYM